MNLGAGEEVILERNDFLCCLISKCESLGINLFRNLCLSIFRTPNLRYVLATSVESSSKSNKIKKVGHKIFNFSVQINQLYSTQYF